MPALKLSIAAFFLLAAGCAANKPVIYPNTHSKSVGSGQVEADIAACKHLAKSAGATPYGGHASGAARHAVRGGAIGAATGAVGGAIGGNAPQGAKIGAASGATASLLHAFLKEPAANPAYRNYVERCLVDRGYDLVGWN